MSDDVLESAPNLGCTLDVRPSARAQSFSHFEWAVWELCAGTFSCVCTSEYEMCTFDCFTAIHIPAHILLNSLSNRLGEYALKSSHHVLLGSRSQGPWLLPHSPWKGDECSVWLVSILRQRIGTGATENVKDLCRIGWEYPNPTIPSSWGSVSYISLLLLLH